ncbi:hypothetical protein H6G25_01485 [Dolichospermum sp. FACHB-1091]|jgi:hypothetical protein|nr:hypothetical protein [Dolichospermum sp. FACHB-1091]MBD2441906.1 hypothetical protein [Dolichospermum sp. FACHB-1091]
MLPIDLNCGDETKKINLAIGELVTLWINLVTMENPHFYGLILTTIL